MTSAPCPVCPGEGRYLGNLGCLAHFRCASCGWTFHEDADPAPEVDEHEYA